MDSAGQDPAVEVDNVTVEAAEALTMARFVLHLKQHGPVYALAALMLAQMGAAEAAAHAAACISA